MQRHDDSLRARLAGDMGAAATLLVAGFIGWKLFDDDLAAVSAGSVVGYVLWSLAAAALVRAALVRAW